RTCVPRRGSWNWRRVSICRRSFTPGHKERHKGTIRFSLCLMFLALCLGVKQKLRELKTYEPFTSKVFINQHEIRGGDRCLKSGSVQRPGPVGGGAARLRAAR